MFGKILFPEIWAKMFSNKKSTISPEQTNEIA